MPAQVILDYNVASKLLQGLNTNTAPTDELLKALRDSVQVATSTSTPSASGSATVIPAAPARQLALVSPVFSIPSVHPGPVNVTHVPRLARLRRTKSVPPENTSWEVNFNASTPVFIPSSTQTLAPIDEDEEMPSPFLSPTPIPQPPPPPPPASDCPSPTSQENSNGKRVAPGEETATRKKVKLILGPNPGAGSSASKGDDHVRCARKADGAHMGADRDIGLMDCDDEGCTSCGGHITSLETGVMHDDDDDDGETEVESKEDDESTRKKKKRKTKTGYKTTGHGPGLTKDAGALLGMLVAGIFLRETREMLDSLLLNIGPETESEKDYASPPDLPGVIGRLDLFATKSHKSSFWYMVMLVQLALHVHSERQETVKRVGGLSPEDLKLGPRLVTLCAASSPYILVIIAVLGMQDDFISRHKSSNQDITALATALREVSHDKWGTLVKRLRIPLDYIRRKCFYLEKYNFCYREPRDAPKKPKIRQIPFFSLIETDEVLESVVTNCPDLPPRSQCWNEPLPLWNVFTDPAQIPMPPLRTITSSLDFKKVDSPVTWKTTDEWTRQQRLIGKDADMCEDMDELEEMMGVLHEEDGQEPSRYIGVPSNILDGHALRIEDCKGKLLAEVFTLPPELLKRLQDSIALLEAAFPGEWKDDDSRRELYAFLSCHFSWYARYGEKGHQAPQDAKHMNNVQQDHGGRTNFTQRIPHESKEMLQNLKEYSTLADAYADIFEYIRTVLEKRHPHAYEQISMYCDILPMNATSPAYPFGGFVVNIRVGTSGHRDPGDELLCVVIPFGTWEGGELCLYEVGLMFDLKMGDVLLFPSCDITHFNMNFTGKRGSLVLHSDREGKAWVRDRRGWGAYIKRTTLLNHTTVLS
ncbi:hypothetical protein C8F04DRAFT_1313727 [Mycena alexandri]|uniref:Uncharacterized protein n=1 Tax=Mycena alexandri TaxID=1745969 RepID=A0AAD6WNZ4_9AGAR|nr:hypothetical protein C8F04DRAFT_1313727 [Mycena alexandri]